MVREVYEETAVRAVPGRLAPVQQTPAPVRCPNGDLCQFVDMSFRCRAVGGRARVNDEESPEVGWFGPDEPPPPEELALTRVERAGSDGPKCFQNTTGE